VTTTTVGYGDYTPVTQAGRTIAAVVMIVGIGLIGTVSATVAAWFVTRPGDTVAEPADDAPATLLDRLDELAAQQDEIRALLIALQRPTTSG
jgi:voltage-gated potassium channel